MEREANRCLKSIAEGRRGRLAREGPGRELYRRGPRPVDAKEEAGPLGSVETGVNGQVFLHLPNNRTMNWKTHRRAKHDGACL